MITAEQKKEIVAKYGKTPEDAGSAGFRSHFYQQESLTLQSI